MYMENKLGYLFADQLLKLYDRHAGQKPPNKETLITDRDSAADRLPRHTDGPI